MKDYEIIKHNEDTYIIENKGVRFFLLLGENKALLIDSGMTVKNAKEIAQSITSLPVSLINTHADIDHIGSNCEFSSPYMHPSELSNYHNTQKASGDITPVWDGDIINLGERALEIIHTPGHTPGSIAIYDRKHRFLFSGDPVQDGHIFMFGVQRDLDAYRLSLKRLIERQSEFEKIFPSHGTCPVEADILERLLVDSEKVSKGEIELRHSEFMGVPVSFYKTDTAVFLCDAKTEMN